jgi:hypothetical protein
MFSTGPMFLTHEASYYSNRSVINVLSQELYGKYVYNASRSLFQHLKGINKIQLRIIIFIYII